MQGRSNTQRPVGAKVIFKSVALITGPMPGCLYKTPPSSAALDKGAIKPHKPQNLVFVPPPGGGGGFN